MKTRSTALIGLLVLATTAIPANQSVALKRTAKEGEKTRYTMKIDLVVQGMDVKVTFDSVQTVLKVNADGSYVTREENVDQVVLVGGQEMPGEEGPEVATMTYGANGVITKIESDMLTGDEYRLSALSTIVWPSKPVDVDSKWQATVPGDKTKGTYETNYDFHILGKETVSGHETFKIKFVVKENGGDASSEGTMWISTKNGNTIKSTGTMKNIPLQGIPMDATYTMTIKG